MTDEIFSLSEDVRYVAIYRDGKLESKSKEEILMAAKSRQVVINEFIQK